MSKRGERPVGFILPALVFGLGVAAMWIGVPDELKVRKLSGSGVKTAGKITAIEHVNKKQILTLSYEVGGKTYSVDSEQDDASAPLDSKPDTSLVYSPDDPSVATANLAKDSKTALEYLLAGLLELFVGGWFTYVAIRQRRTALLKALAEKRAKGR